MLESACSVALDPCSHSMRYTLAKVAGSIAVIVAFPEMPCRRPAVKAIGVTVRDAGDAAQRRERRARGSPASLLAWEFSTIRSPAKERVTARLIVALVPAARTATKRDQREADRQRGGGRERAAGLADRVLARQAPGDPAPAHEPADRPRERRA